MEIIAAPVPIPVKKLFLALLRALLRSKVLIPSNVAIMLSFLCTMPL